MQSASFDFEVFDQENNAKCTIFPRCRICTAFKSASNDSPKVYSPRTTHHQAANSFVHVVQRRVSVLNMTRAEEHYPTLEKKRPRGRSRSSSRTFDANNRSNSSVAASVGSRRRSPQREREFASQIPGSLTLDQCDLSVAATVGQQPSPGTKRDFASPVPSLLTLKRAPVTLVTLPATLSETLAPASNKEFQSPDTKEIPVGARSAEAMNVRSSLMYHGSLQRRLANGGFLPSRRPRAAMRDSSKCEQRASQPTSR